MTAKIATLANALKDDLDAAVAADTFSQEFTTSILWAARTLDLSTAKGDRLTVAVVPLMYWKQLDAARESADQIVVDILVRKRITLSEQDLDTGLAKDSVVLALIDLVDELVEWAIPGGDQDGRLDSLAAAVMLGGDEEDEQPATEIVINWERLGQGFFEAYFPLVYTVS